MPWEIRQLLLLAVIAACSIVGKDAPPLIQEIGDLGQVAVSTTPKPVCYNDQPWAEGIMVQVSLETILPGKEGYQFLRIEPSEIAEAHFGGNSRIWPLEPAELFIVSKLHSSHGQPRKEDNEHQNYVEEYPSDSSFFPSYSMPFNFHLLQLPL